MEGLTIRTGGGYDEDELKKSVADAAMRLLTPCLEAAAILAGAYARGCGRDTVVSRDFDYALKFAARHVLGKHLESFLAEAEDEDDDADSDASLLVEEGEEVWSRYEGGDERLCLVNACAESWNEWAPETPLEEALKRAIDSSTIP